MMLPDLDGREILKGLAACRPPALRAVFVMTGHMTTERVAEVQQLGDDTLLGKPVDATRLIAVLRTCGRRPGQTGAGQSVDGQCPKPFDWLRAMELRLESLPSPRIPGSSPHRSGACPARGRRRILPWRCARPTPPRASSPRNRCRRPSLRASRSGLPAVRGSPGVPPGGCGSDRIDRTSAR